MEILDRSPLLRQTIANHRPAGTKSPMVDEAWDYVQPMTLDEFSTADWVMLDTQRKPYLETERPKQALEMLSAQADAPTFGYQVNNYEHCLQAATMAMKDGLDEETIVVSLFHDLGFISNNETHGEFSAMLLKPYVSSRHVWTLERHMYFQAIHCAAHPQVDPDIRERWRGHEDFEYAAEWVAKYDICSFDPNYDSAPLDTFIPMVHRVFANPHNEISLPV